MAPSVILFDLDGTLIDTAPDMVGALNSLRREHGLAPLPFAEAALLHLERQLARQVGPIARILVRRAATRCSSIEQLRGQLAAEIESERGRREFIVGASS